MFPKLRFEQKIFPFFNTMIQFLFTPINKHVVFFYTTCLFEEAMCHCFSMLREICSVQCKHNFSFIYILSELAAEATDTYGRINLLLAV